MTMHSLKPSTAITAEVIHRRGPWRSFEAVEFASLEFGRLVLHNRRLMEPVGNIPPAEAKQRYYAMLDNPPWRHKLNQIASGKPEAVHGHLAALVHRCSLIALKRVAAVNPSSRIWWALPAPIGSLGQRVPISVGRDAGSVLCRPQEAVTVATISLRSRA